MNCKEANEILIADFLYSKGIEPKKVIGNSYWYLSPLRNENTPSFKVDVSINRWYDHGMAVGGKLVDLGVRLHQISVAEFLDMISIQNFSNSFSFQKHNHETSKPIIKKVKALENKGLLCYLNDRAIETSIAKIFCNEVYYSIDEKNYFGIGFKNDLGGYEIRNKYFKGCIGGSKGIRTVKGNKTNSFVLFEGFFDFLSVFQKGGIITDYSFIILNSVNQINHAIVELQQYNPDFIICYFDNDETGKKCFQNLKAVFPNAIDRSHRYNGYKDINELAMASNPLNLIKHKNQNI